MTQEQQATIIAAFETSVRNLYEATGTQHCCARFELCIYKDTRYPLAQIQPAVVWQYYTHERGHFQADTQIDAFCKALAAHSPQALLDKAKDLEREAAVLRATAELQSV